VGAACAWSCGDGRCVGASSASSVEMVGVWEHPAHEVVEMVGVWEQHVHEVVEMVGVWEHCTSLTLMVMWV